MNLHKYVSDSINKKLGFEAKLDVPKNRDFGDFATNAAMVGAKSAGKNPRELANEYLPLLKELDFVADVSIAGPGFINIKIKFITWLNNIHKATFCCNTISFFNIIKIICSPQA